MNNKSNFIHNHKKTRYPSINEWIYFNMSIQWTAIQR